MTTPMKSVTLNDKATIQQSELALAQRLKRVEHENAVLQCQIKILNAELTKSKHVVQQLKDLYDLVDGKIIRLINRRGYRRKNKTLGRVVDVAPYSKKSSLEELLTAAAEYDVRNNFVFNSKNPGMRLGYRIVGRAYRFLRDSVIAVTRFTYRVAVPGARRGGE